MKLWIVNPYEAIHGDVVASRVRRCGLVAETAVSRGHEVLWWNADFFHAEKRFRYGTDRTIQSSAGYEVRFLNSSGYKKNVELSRLWDHRQIAQKLGREMSQLAPPDLIFCSFPPIDMTHTAVKYGRRHAVPTVVDVRDMWPDAMLDVVPPSLKRLARIAKYPLERKAGQVLGGASTIFGHCPAFVEWGMARAGRPRVEDDQDYPFGYAVPSLTQGQHDQARQFWKAQGLDPESNVPIVCFFGQLGRIVDYNTLFDGIHRSLAKMPIHFVLCGDGPEFKQCQDLARNSPFIHLPGWVNSDEIWALMEMSMLAIYPYRALDSFKETLGNKVIEYLAGGLPILSSIKGGYTANLLAQHRCGDTYDADSEKFASLVVGLLGDRESCEKMGANARRLFQARFESETVYNRLLADLEKLARQGR